VILAVKDEFCNIYSFGALHEDNMLSFSQRTQIFFACHKTSNSTYVTNDVSVTLESMS
jgi:hypothetical protein